VLRAESVPEPGGPGKMFGKELQGDEAAQLDVLGLINHTHPAALTSHLAVASLRACNKTTAVATCRVAWNIRVTRPEFPWLQCSFPMPCGI
jgi:hypothetical protein